MLLLRLIPTALPPVNHHKAAAATRTKIRLKVHAMAKQSSEGSGITASEVVAIGSGLIASPVIWWSLYTLKTTGCGLPPGPGGSIGGLEGVSYLIVVGIVSWSLYTKSKTGSGLPNGLFGLLGAVEGLSYLSLLAIIIMVSVGSDSELKKLIISLLDHATTMVKLTYAEKMKEMKAARAAKETIKAATGSGGSSTHPTRKEASLPSQVMPEQPPLAKRTRLHLVDEPVTEAPSGSQSTGPSQSGDQAPNSNPTIFKPKSKNITLELAIEAVRLTDLGYLKSLPTKKLVELTTLISIQNVALERAWTKKSVEEAREAKAKNVRLTEECTNLVAKAK